jgi:hypothetical protein
MATRKKKKAPGASTSGAHKTTREEPHSKFKNQKQEDAGDGSVRHQREDQASWQAHEGRAFDDSDLLARGYKRTIFDYELPDSTLLYQQCRYDPTNDMLQPGVDAPKKRFLPRRPEFPATFDRATGSGSCLVGAGPRRVIYNWPAIMRAGPGSLVFVTEGEKNAQDLIKVGLLATTVLSHKWTPGCVAALTDYEVIILEDNDNDGRRQAATVQRLLTLGAAKSTRVVPATHLWKHLAPERAAAGPPEKADVSDWLHFGGDPNKLIDICREVPVEGAFTATPHSFPDEATLPVWDFLYGKHLLRGTVSITAAMGGTGKTSKSIVEALAMVIGKSLLGEEVPRQLRVLLINLEDNREAMDKRIAAVMKHYKLKPEEVGGRLFTKAKGELKLKVAKRARNGSVERNEAIIKGLSDFIVANKIDVVNIDPLIKTHGINENDTDAMQEVIECYDDIVQGGNCAIHLWHHMRKSGGGDVTIESIRGASAIVDACRSSRILISMTKGEADKLNLKTGAFHFREFSGRRTFAPPTDQSTWYELINVTLNNGFGDNVGVVTQWAHPGTKDVELTPYYIGEIKKVVGVTPKWRHNIRANMWVGIAVAQVLGLDPEDERAVVKRLVQMLLRSGALKRKEDKSSERKDVWFVVAGEDAPVQQPAQPKEGGNM